MSLKKLEWKLLLTMEADEVNNKLGLNKISLTMPFVEKMEISANYHI